MTFLKILDGTLRVLASIAGLGAFGLAVHAYFYPATVSNYLQRLSVASEVTANNTGATATNTNALANALPRWPNVQLSLLENGTCTTDCELLFYVENSSSIDFIDATIVFIDTSQNFYKIDLGVILSGDVKTLKPMVDGQVEEFCLTATDPISRSTISDYRSILPHNPASDQLLFATRDIGLQDDVTACLDLG